MRDREARFLDPMLDRRSDFIGNVLNQRPAPRDVEDLNPAADREQRQVRINGAPHQLHFVLVAPRVRRIECRMRRCAVQRGLHVAAADQQQAVDTGNHI